MSQTGVDESVDALLTLPGGVPAFGAAVTVTPFTLAFKAVLLALSVFKKPPLPGFLRNELRVVAPADAFAALAALT